MFKTTFAVMMGAAAMTVLPAANAAASDVDDPWLVRVRAISVMPEEDGTIRPIGGTVDIGDQIVPELDISYFVSENIAFELILGVTNHDVNANATSVGDVDLGDVWLLPPTVTAQYHFNPRGGFRPYVGAGVNYTVFFGEDEGDVTSIDYSNEFGFALQAGADIPINDTWFFNADVKKLWLSTDVKVDAGGVAVEADADINPWIVGIGLGRRF
ncbi:OmpW family protein [uncultured Algimonas sp.]|uniref:OmpW/AlkL family protein n=1 Tax=uncultured Algimonas sp. TaxID=1547920 RepID=UPI002610FB7B|nr:OmpW family protein [uncultured Algimonas sp.]